MADLTLTQADVISLLLAASSDKQMNVRLANLQGKLEEIEAANLNTARAKAEAEAMSQNLAGKRAELEQFERTLSDHNQALIAEKDTWEKIRQDVDAKQKEGAEWLKKWELDLKARDDAVTSREVGAKARQSAADQRMAEAEAKISALRSALEAVDPEPPAEKDAA